LLPAISLPQRKASIGPRIPRFSGAHAPAFSGPVLKSCYSPIPLQAALVIRILANERSYSINVDQKMLSWIKGGAGFAFHEVRLLFERCAVQYLFDVFK
jgi:hypothetical protein